jgi:hypothetical protein
MALPPEVLFHRYFSTLSAIQRKTYRGKSDICEPAFDPSIVSLLLGIQSMMNSALAAENQHVADHVPHDPFYFDYVDSEDPNAIAFCYEGYSFVGITVPFVRRCLQVARGLAAGSDVVRLIGAPPEYCGSDGLLAAFARLQLFSIVAHEWAHHVHGHLAAGEDGAPFAEFADHEGNLDLQARELDADGYSAYLILANLFDSPERVSALQGIGCEQKSAAEQDESLFALFVCALEGQLSARPFLQIHEKSVYERTHPPPALRMNSIVLHAQGWCRQNRPDLLNCHTMKNLGPIMTAVGSVTWQMNGGVSWDDDVRFLRSEEGQRYCDVLTQKVNRLKDELSARANAPSP